MMDNHYPCASPSGTGERSPFKDQTNTPVDVHGNENPTCEDRRENNSKGAQSWYARLSDEKRAEYNQKRRTLYKEKKAAEMNTVNHEHVPQAPASSLLGMQRTPLSNITNTLHDGICMAATSVSTYHQTERMDVRCKKRTVPTVPDMKMDNHNPGASPTNTPTNVHGNENPTCENRRENNSKGAQSWYARLSDEKKAEYNQKRRTLYKVKKAATMNTVNHEHPFERTPLSNITNPLDDGICTAAASASTDQLTQRTPLSNITNPVADGSYATLSDAKKEEYREKLRISRLEKKAADIDVQLASGIDHLESAPSGVSQMLNTPSTGSAMDEDPDIDWLHTNPTYQRQTIDIRDVAHMSVTEGMHGLESYLPNLVASSEKKRQRMKEKYAGMTVEEKDIVLRRKRAYKMGVRHTLPADWSASGSAIPSSSTPGIYGQPFGQYYRSGGNNNDEESDVAGIFEPAEPSAVVEESLHNIHDEQPMYGDDEECRIFSGQGDEFESYRVRPDGSHAFETHDPYDYVYKNLPNKHHVLKPVKDCVHCRAMRFQYEGPAFCCRKGKVKVFIPEVPQELQRLFTSQVDTDAKYFRKHIRYFNSHFSFTSLGVTLDQRVNTAARTGIYTFRAHGQLYHRLDHLVPGDHGPRHLQLYIYDTDEALEHRVKRSPDLDITLIWKILRILENNPYVETFKSLGSVPDLAECKITLNTNITLDQRRYNAPTASQVAAMWVEGSDPQHTFDRSVIVHAKGDRPLYIRAYYGCYDPFAYPLFHPGGETGWNRWLPYEGPTPAQAGNEDDDDNQDDDQEADDNEEQDEDEASESRKYVSAREYYCFKLQIREGIFNIVSFGGRLFQQWIVDMYIKMETIRLDFYSQPQNQKLIRAELYQLT